MIPFSQDKISTSPAGTDFPQRLHGEINFYHAKAGQFPPGAGICLKKAIDSHWFKIVHKIMKFNEDTCLLFSHRMTSYTGADPRGGPRGLVPPQKNLISKVLTRNKFLSWILFYLRFNRILYFLIFILFPFLIIL